MGYVARQSTAGDALTIRAATADDLRVVYDIWLDAEMPGRAPAVAAGVISPNYWQERETGTMLIAERGGQPVAFSSVVVRSEIVFLAELFVRPAEQSAHVGRHLLDAILPADARIRCTMASRDPRALSRYVRAGMRPRWPNIWVRIESDRLGALPGVDDVSVTEAAAGDPDLIAWDATVSGRYRPQDFAFWAARGHGVPLWFRRGSRTLGYGLVQLRSEDSPWNPAALTIGPVGARTEADAHDCVLAAVGWARHRGEVLRLGVPGPHPALAPLLDAHGEIVYTETFACSGEGEVFDPRHYLASSALL